MQNTCTNNNEPEKPINTDQKQNEIASEQVILQPENINDEDSNNNKKTDKKKKTKKKKKNSKHKYMFQFIGKCATILIISWLLLTFVFSVTVIKGNYMYPALKDGDLAIMYRLENEVTGEVVSYKTKSGVRCGRIVAMAGDTVDITESGELIVNGSNMTEEIFYPTSLSSNIIQYPYTVPQDSVFILNDYRTLDEIDSRTLGAVPKSDLGGKLEFLFRRRGF